MNSTLAPTPPVSLAAPRNRLPLLLLFATLALLWFILCRDLSLEWSSNEQYSYGWFVPFFAAFLFWLRWEEWWKVESRNSKVEIENAKAAVTAAEQVPGFQNAAAFPSLYLISALAFLLLFLLFPVRLFEVANPDWRPLSWIHAFLVVSLTLLVIFYLGGSRAVRHFAFPVCFILVAVPWLTPIEGPLVQWLMRIVAAVATETLTLLGIPAELEGSLIRVNSGVVGVSEACSGVRSLQTSLMIGLLFGELKRLTISRRVALVGAALTIALLANFVRALFLVWIAAVQNLAAVERWHDIAGYAIVAAVFIGTVALASALAKTPGSARLSRVPARDDFSPPPIASPAPGPPSSILRLPPSAFLLSVLLYLLLIEASVAGWYGWHEHLLARGKEWTVHFPESALDFRELPIDAHTREMLRYDTARQATWMVSPIVRRDAADALATERAPRIYLFFFRWQPGTATVLRARAHRPDICLPAVGWRQLGEPAIRSYPVTQNLALPFQHFRFVHEEPGGGPVYAEAFFCLREDRIAAEARGKPESLAFSHWSIPERWEVVREGLRNPGQQVMELVLLSKNASNPAESEREFAELIPGLVKVGSAEESKKAGSN
ncbi:MAG TPA: exosortase/archaeosortase family protein [Chthoniobacterales bacterium]|nr:exosortase/archaeosortase family protein [Chthoniobacterales bacterium]